MSLGLLTGLLLFGAACAQTAKSAELPIEPKVDCIVEKSEPATVGQIIIIGNEATPQNVILKQVPLYPGQVLTYPDLRTAEQNLQRLDIFKVATVEVIDPDSDNPVKDIRIEVEETRTGSLMFGVGVNSNTGLTGYIVLSQQSGCYAEEEPEVLEVIPTREDQATGLQVIDAMLGAALGGEMGHAEVIEVMPHQETSSESPCPYFRQQPRKPMNPEPCPAETVLDKLDQIQRARTAFERGEKCHRSGDLEAATAWYEQAIQVCPGSPIEHRAQVRLKKLERQHAELMAPASSTEEAEPEIVDRAEPLPCREPTPLEAEVAEILEACQRAIAEDDRAQARLLVYQALLLDPHCIAAKALAEKLQQPVPTEENKEEPAEEPSESAPADPISAPPEAMQPPLPPVDPGIVEALEKVLRETGEPTAPKLVIGVEEAQEEEVEEPVSQWRQSAPDVEIPSLVTDPEGEDQPLLDPDDGDSEAIPSAELEKLLVEVREAIEQGNYLDLKTPPADSLNYVFRGRIGGIECAITVDDWGHRYIIVNLTAEASGDLRLMQDEHIERVTNWINNQNNGGNLEERLAEPAEPEDEDLERLRNEIEDIDPTEEMDVETGL